MLHYGSPSLIIDPNQWTILALRVVRQHGADSGRGRQALACTLVGLQFVMVGWVSGYDSLHDCVSCCWWEYRKSSYLFCFT